MLDARRKYILKSVLNEFIKTGEPVSSLDLYEKYDFDIKPAMIRNELFELSKMGYLEQPYYSSGRIPTDLAYEFLIEEIINSENLNINFDKKFVDLFYKRAWRDLARQISEMLEVLGFITDLPKEEFIYKEGLDNLIDNFEWQTKEEIKQLIFDFENLEKRVINRKELLKDKNFIKIFIGRKNPLTRNKSLSIIASDFDLDNQRILILAIGSKRMNYKKAYCLFKGLKNYFYSNGSRN